MNDRPRVSTATLKPVSALKLVEFSREHLYYEIRMLYGACALLKKNPENVYVRNSLLESFVIHASIILDFFYKPPIKADDAIAVHFMKDKRKWKSALPPFDKYFRKFGRKRNREVVHLSYKRLDLKPHQKKWYSYIMVEQIKKIVDIFLEEADSGLIHPVLYELKSKNFKI